ncbi:hypothetical protein ACQJBY_035606 [Aegilops geniculata]
MDKYAIHILALATLVSLHLVCSATFAQCQTTGGTDSRKINLPYGLCVHVGPNGCNEGAPCFHCLLNDVYYSTMDECKIECYKSSSLQDTIGALTMPHPAPLPAH